MRVKKFNELHGYTGSDSLDEWPSQPVIEKPAVMDPKSVAKNLAAAVRKFKSLVPTTTPEASQAWSELDSLLRAAETL